LSTTVEQLRVRLKERRRPQAKKLKLAKRQVSTVSVTVDELVAAIEANPTHPVAEVYALSTEGFPGDRELAVEKPDLEALLDDRRVEIYAELEKGRKVLKKRVIDKPSQPFGPDPATEE
jgi:hypothetical protein